MRWLFKSDFRSFYLLNATQFLGALNDNIFKLLVIYLFIYVKGAASAPTILSLAGAIFVIPFLLFSSGAGVLADKISKRTIIVITKVLEVVIMLFAVLSVLHVFSAWQVKALFSALRSTASYRSSSKKKEFLKQTGR
jgi:acyl-[acyl-carrier-protein]-phospholipid O-acyltransferase / long-chain-fatty-acid--[acyl-carrier-protein] ligase